MEFTCLGRTGLQVSRLCLGTMNFGPRTSEEEAHAIMDLAHETGINFFDTSNRYGSEPGETETIIGNWFASGGWPAGAAHASANSALRNGLLGVVWGRLHMQGRQLRADHHSRSALSTGRMQARRDTWNPSTRVQAGRAVLLKNSGPPPSLCSALHPASID
jgi:hypothetical protein